MPVPVNIAFLRNEDMGQTGQQNSQLLYQCS